MLIIFSFLLINSLIHVINAKTGVDRSLISAQIFNFQFSDPVSRLLCTKDPNYNREVCKRDAFDSLEQLDFFIIGDMGGSSEWLAVKPYTTHAQRSVATAMAQLAEKEQPHFIVNLGDNFYLNGVKEVNDERFQKTFEEVYDEKTLGVPWFNIAGNHDYHGNVQAEIDYTNRSTRWTFSGKNADEPWYKIRYEFGKEKFTTPVTLDIFFIDTVMLCGMTEDVRGDSKIQWIFHESHENPHTPIPGKEAHAKSQWEWISSGLQKSDATYILVAGHYPIHSVGKHGSFYECLKQLDSSMRAAGVSAYLSGHDHSLQHLRVDNGLTAMNYIVSGAGAATDRSQEHWKEFKAISGSKVLLQYPAEHWWWKADELFSWSTGGFIQAKATPDNIKLSFFSGQGSACLGNVPLIGGWLQGKGGPANLNCRTLVHETRLCPRKSAQKCLEEQKEEKEQSKAGWLFNGKNWWCAYLC